MNKRAEWWPPKAGDKLRHLTRHERNGESVLVEALVHVLAVFEHAGDGVHAAVAEWFPGRARWHYEVIDDVHAIVGSYWPDGQPNPHK